MPMSRKTAQKGSNNALGHRAPHVKHMIGLELIEQRVSKLLALLNEQESELSLVLTGDAEIRRA